MGTAWWTAAARGVNPSNASGTTLDSAANVCHYRDPMSSVCPRCANARDQRDGPFFVCTDCRCCWTVSITGLVYVQSDWPRPAVSDPEDESEMPRRLLASVDSLSTKLAAPWPPPGLPSGEASLRRAGFRGDEIARLRNVRAAAEADYFNEGMPRAQLRAEGIPLDT